MAVLTAGALLAGCAAGAEEDAAGDDRPAATQPAETEPAETETGTPAGEPTGEPLPSPPPKITDGATLDSETLVGTLGGSAELEGGCAWLDTDRGRFEVTYPEGYRVEFDPLRLIGPDSETVAEEGDEITVHGSPADDLMSICQVGAIFQATDVEGGSA